VRARERHREKEKERERAIEKERVDTLFDGSETLSIRRVNTFVG